MRTRILLLMTVLVLVPLPSVAPARAECDPHGVSTFRGDAQYPPGWITSFGVIEISPPDETVYAVIDGAASLQQFTQIKAKLRSRITDRIMGPGTVTAMARYHLRTDYQPDLSTDPPTMATRQKEPSLSISAPVAVDVISSDTPLQLVFDFTEQPVPAGITDLFFIVMYQGDIEGIETPVSLVGFKDLNEPHHVVNWNLTDYFLLNYRWYTGQQIRADQTLLNYLYDNCWFMDSYVDPMDIELYVGFTAAESDTPVYVAHYQNIPAGRFGRLIIIAEAQEIWMQARSVTHSPGPDETLDWTMLMPDAINQVDASGFEFTAPVKFRHITGHSYHGWTWTCPYDEQISSELIEEMYAKAPAEATPVQTATISFP